MNGISSLVAVLNDQHLNIIIPSLLQKEKKQAYWHKSIINCVGFAARELAVRIRHAQPKVIISASCGVEPSRLIRYYKFATFVKDFT